MLAVKAFVILVCICGDSESKRSAMFVYKQPELSFNANFINLTWDFSVYQNSSKEHPVEVIPAIDIKFMKDLTRVFAFVKIMSLKHQEDNFQGTLNLCSLNDKPGTGIVLKTIVDNLQKAANFKFRCPFTKGSRIHIGEFTTKNIFFSPFVAPYTEKSFTLVLKEGKRATPVMSVVIYYMRVEVDE